MFRVGAQQSKDDDKGQIVCLRAAGKSYREISEQTGYSKSTISRWLSRFEASGSCKRKEGSGLDTKTTAQQDVDLALAALENNFSTSYELKHRVGLGNLQDRTIQKKISKLTGLKSRIARVKQALTPENQEARLEYAIRNRNKTIEDWGRIIF